MELTNIDGNDPKDYLEQIRKDLPDNVIKLTPPQPTYVGHFYNVANSLPISDESKRSLIAFIDRMVRYGNTEWVVRILNLHLRKYSE